MKDNITYPRLVADVGGTNARFAIEKKPYHLDNIKTLSCADFPSLLFAINSYLKDLNINISNFVIAIANPVKGDYIKMTNNHWEFSIKETKEALSAEFFIIINDFTAQALATVVVNNSNLIQVGGKTNNSKDTKAVVGPGTGLGVAGLILDSSEKWMPITSEGGHTSFSPRDDLEKRLLSFAIKKHGQHISIERILQGSGFSLLYEFFCLENNVNYSKKTPSDITNAALIDKDPICLDVLSRYCMILGNFCADIALTMGATGGLFVSGGIVPRFTQYLIDSNFRNSFENKGRLYSYLRSIPIYIVTHPNPGLLGAMLALKQEIN